MQTPGHTDMQTMDRPGTSLAILIVEDDSQVASEMAASLELEGYVVSVVDDGLVALDLAAAQGFDVMIVDRMLPRLDGVSFVRALRTRGNTTPVLLVTALGTVADRVVGLENGADDYLVKPFAFDELHARVRALKRRSRDGQDEPTRLACGALDMNRLARRVYWEASEIDLLPLEYRLLEVLLMNAGRPVTRMMLLEQVWGFRFDPRTNIVETHISHLRSKLEAAGAQRLVKTIRGAGYVIDPDPGPTPA